MSSLERLARFDANAARRASAALGAAFGALWVVGLAAGATPWLTWLVALAGLACFGATALLPERRPGFAAAGNLAFVAAGLVASWIVARVAHATPWLAWCCFGFALAVGLVAFSTALAAILDHPSFLAVLTSMARTGARRARPSKAR